MDEIAGAVERIHPQSCAKFAIGVENKATGELKLNDSPDLKMFRTDEKCM